MAIKVLLYYVVFTLTDNFQTPYHVPLTVGHVHAFMLWFALATMVGKAVRVCASLYELHLALAGVRPPVANKSHERFWNLTGP